MFVQCSSERDSDRRIGQEITQVAFHDTTDASIALGAIELIRDSGMALYGHHEEPEADSMLVEAIRSQVPNLPANDYESFEAWEAGDVMPLFLSPDQSDHLLGHLPNIHEYGLTRVIRDQLNKSHPDSTVYDVGVLSVLRFGGEVHRTQKIAFWGARAVSYRDSAHFAAWFPPKRTLLRLDPGVIYARNERTKGSSLTNLLSGSVGVVIASTRNLNDEKAHGIKFGRKRPSPPDPQSQS